MKLPPLMPVPWDMVVFLTITTVGLGFSVQKVRYPSIQSPRETTSLTQSEPEAGDEKESNAQTSTNQMIDLGCLERKVSFDRVTSPERTIRFKGKLCNLSRRAMRNFDGIKVKNVSNGYEGTIFFHGTESTFVSDALMLGAGKNLIQVEWRENRVSPPRVYKTEVFQR